MSTGQLEAFVVSGENPDKGGWIQLPISREDFLEAVAAIGVADPAKDSIRVTIVEPELEVLSPHLKEPFDLNELNYFAAKLGFLEEMSDERFQAFAANLQAGRHCGSVAEMINLLENIGRVDLYPAFSPEEYGAFQINLARDEYADMMDKLEQSSNPEERAFFSYIAEMETHIDLASYGKAQAENENGVFTDYGYLTESAAFHEVYRGAQDIPAEFQACPFPHTELLLKLEHTDLTDVLTKIHDLGGYANDVERNLETLHRRRSADFLLLLTGDKAVLSEAMHVYRAGTAAHDAFIGAENAKMYSIYVTDFQTDFIGHIREVDAGERRTDILAHSIHFVDVRAVTFEGESVMFTPEEWKNVGPAERDSYQSWARQFADGDFSKVNHHITHLYGKDGFWSRPATLNEFFSKLEQDVPTKAERTPEEKPKSVLARIAAARAELTSEPPKPEQSKHRAEPER